ncbi:MAG: MoaD/ThiS family protein [Pseudomonadota bacterium]
MNKDDGMRVKIRTARALTHSMPEGKDIIEGQNLTVRGLIEALVARYGDGLEKELLDQGNLRSGLSMLVNGRNILSLPEKYETPLQDGDEVLIAIIVAGG